MSLNLECVYAVWVLHDAWHMHTQGMTSRMLVREGCPSVIEPAENVAVDNYTFPTPCCVDALYQSPIRGSCLPVMTSSSRPPGGQSLVQSGVTPRW